MAVNKGWKVVHNETQNVVTVDLEETRSSLKLSHHLALVTRNCY